ncbi:hypothetical protein [Ascidiimonas aurantiaca]|uniref:hypothetical protein n=1 Tax=Ascidiimonas aurantiaca TaxID=1685432 RepID=UPI0030EBE005
MNRKIIFDFGFLELHEYLAIGTINEGEDLTFDQNKLLFDACIQHYDTKNFGYISNRLHSYSVNPMGYINASQISQLQAIAVVITHPAQRLSAEVEKIFFNKPFEYFEHLDEAKAWIRKIVILANQKGIV